MGLEFMLFREGSFDTSLGEFLTFLDPEMRIEELEKAHGYEEEAVEEPFVFKVGVYHYSFEPLHILYQTIIHKKEPEMRPKTVPQPELDYFEKNYCQLVKKYKGKWIAISGKQLVAVGQTLLEAKRLAEAAGYRSPFLTRLVPEGWES